MPTQKFGSAPQQEAQRVYILGGDGEQERQIREIRRPDYEGFEDEADLVGPVPSAIDLETGGSPESLAVRLEWQTRRSDLLSELTRLLASSLKLEDILDRVVDRSMGILGDRAFIVLTDGLERPARRSEGREEFVAAANKMIRSDPERLAVPAAVEALTRGQPVTIWDFNDLTLSGEMRRQAEQWKVQSLVASPIRTRRRVLGAFVSMAIAPNHFDANDAALAGELSAFAAVAIENGRLFTELQRTAITDPLTGLFNTRFFHDLLGRETARADRFQDPLSLLMLDIDDFKRVNDTYGHVVGNKALAAVGRLVNECIRNTDFVFRCGGDEFGVVLPGTPLAGAVLVAEKIRASVERSELLAELGYHGTVTLSVGVSEYTHKTHFETLVAAADQALYASKRASKNCVRTAARA